MVIFPVVPAAGPLADTADLVTVRLETDGSALVGVVGVADMAGMAYNDVDAAADIMFIVEFDVGGVPWDLRADYIAANGVTGEAWQFLLRPDGQWDGAVPAQGVVDKAAGTVTMTVPVALVWDGNTTTDLTVVGGTVQLGTTASADFVDFLDAAPTATIVLEADAADGPAAVREGEAEAAATNATGEAPGGSSPGSKGASAPGLVLALVALAVTGLARSRRRR